MLQNNFLLSTDLAAGDLIGFIFFIGYMAMFAATVFFFSNVKMLRGIPKILKAFAPYRNEHINRFGSYDRKLKWKVKPLQHELIIPPK